MNEMTCEECLAWLHAYLDGELDAATAEEVARHLRHCAGCQGVFAGPEALRDCLRKHLPYHAAPADLRRAILMQVHARACGCPGVVGRFRGWSRWVLPILIGALLLLAAVRHHDAPAPRDALGEELVASHVRSLLPEHLTDVTTADPDAIGRWLAGKLDFAPPVADFAHAGFALVGARLDYVGNRTVAALVFRHGEHLVNLFAMPTALTNAEPRAHARRGFNLVSWRRNGLAFAAVSDLGVERLEALARLITRGRQPVAKRPELPAE